MGCVELCGSVLTAPRPKTRHTVTDADGFQIHFISLVHFTGLAPLLVSMSGTVNTPLQQESIPVGCIPPAVVPLGGGSSGRVATAQGKQGIWFLLFPDRENTGNSALTQGKFLRHRENIFL